MFDIIYPYLVLLKCVQDEPHQILLKTTNVMKIALFPLPTLCYDTMKKNRFQIYKSIQIWIFI